MVRTPSGAVPETVIRLSGLLPVGRLSSLAVKVAVCSAKALVRKLIRERTQLLIAVGAEAETPAAWNAANFASSRVASRLVFMGPARTSPMAW